MKCSKYLKLPLFLFPFLLIGCTERKTTTIEKKINITFIQRPFLDFSYDENGERNGYFLKNETIATTVIEFEMGYFLSENDIKEISKNRLNYKVPELNGDGYWSFTFFVVDYDPESFLANNYLEPQKLNKDFNVYFAIYG